MSEMTEQMKKYKCHKEVYATPMTREAYNNYRGWELPDEENGADDGYLVEYVDGGDSNHPNHSNYISWSPKDVFERGYEEIHVRSKFLHNTDINGAKKNVRDIKVFGNGDMFQLLSKASSENEGWMKSTKACDVGNGCLVQVTTQQRNQDDSYAVAEALTFVPNVMICQHPDGGRFLASRGMQDKTLL